MVKSNIKLGEKEFNEEFSKTYSYDEKATMISANIAYYSGLHYNKEKLEKWNRISEYYYSPVYVKRQRSYFKHIGNRFRHKVFKLFFWLWKKTGVFIMLNNGRLVISFK